MKKRRSGRFLPPVLAGLATSVVVAALAFANGGAGTQAAAVGGGAPTASPTAIGQLELDGKTMPVLAYSAGIENTFSLGSGSGGAGAGKASLSAIEVSKPVDANTPWLNQGVAMGKSYPKAVLTVQWGTGSSTATMKYELDLVFVQKADQAGGGAGAPTETLSLLFGKVTWTYSDAAGTKTGSWNGTTNSP